jgi:haloacid dehalogenase superfamily, subfamily IA, variant 1 with third motif having Dx(3-4)D or Dx(3-4)E
MINYFLLFDFDYTLADSSAGIIECVNFALQKMGFKKAGSKVICRLIGLTLDDTFTELTGERQAERINEFKMGFKKRADEVMADLTFLYDSVADTFRILKNDGHRIGIVSTKFRYRIEAILQREGILELTDVIIGGEDVKAAKPDPEGVFQAVAKIKFPLSQCIFIGDSTTDARTAQNAGIAFIASLTGATTKKEFKNFPVRYFIRDMKELPGCLAQETGSLEEASS